jgi:hypothetical protein
MVTYFLTIDHVLSSDSQVLARVIPTMERAQELLGTLEVVSDCQPRPALSMLVISCFVCFMVPGDNGLRALHSTIVCVCQDSSSS